MDYDKILSRRAVAIKPSGIRRFFDIAAEMDDVISLGVGEPDFKTPWNIRRAGIESLERGHTWYTANSGLMQLREAACGYLKRRFTLEYDPKKELLITVGGSEAIDIAIRALVEPGDEVLVVEPSFVCYTPITELTGGVPVPIATRAGDAFRLTPEQLKAAITPRTKLLILPFPNNPTGAVMRRAHLEAIAGVLRGTGIMVLSDEIYAELTYGDERHISFAEIDGMKERTILVQGFSKSYAMTGWRLGYAAGPAPVIKQMTKIHQFSIMCAPTTSQYAAVEALRNGDADIEEMRGQYDMRRRLLVDGLNRMGLDCFSPEGAFYVFPSIRSTGLSSSEFCMRLLEAERVAVVPGDAFGESGEGFVRISYSYSVNHLLEALKRIDRFLKTL
ncbi:aminotransferase class I/II-fold pyridoxal phosphate-dependent enzyme [Anaerotruncus colihominis]|uniref:Aminotransferase n=1 Tax=Anaerotruncus colihominis TaxID=169435 RepID=A0A3E3IJR8_9FIRM|nr:aminotransferase class I/II-fold pyridoxal phosphate-dependent enzyme [Anaerotruncus colihominis]MBS4989380.1 aminotransferase class I/II-fold pyridoxal phosphate-dependent enzyme [Anaerotruncus colihominis]MCQ4732524.1 aminotransferase class I/II-fold pyridoxal phosphate-dependent enzyme [Anaerotruncus colihominis]RGE67320.1 aminotransferase class I/II-fold pyridoxal phosphate-dependent enzyme [Anaerotruncus colihominis]